ncbi:MAG: cytochrome c maturation protein CcmE [Flavobacteriales bacterium]|nr:cytochrome c maturation protein CcmE [Flavobacteriales bacterium]
MKKSQIILIVVIAVAAGIILSTYMDTSTSVTFSEAFAHPGEEYKVSGTLDKSREVVYDPQVDASLCTFYVVDANGESQKVYYRNSADPKPMGLEQSESIDMHGKVVDGQFQASQVLMKCPSKYNENKHMMDETASNGSN